MAIVYTLIVFWILFFSSYFLWRLYRKRKQYLLGHPEILIPKNCTYQYINKLTKKSFENKNLSMSPPLKVFLVHGTFVGEDPFHLISLLGQVFPADFSKIIKKITKKSNDFFNKDFGNFTSEHTDRLENIFSNDVQIHLFHWTSGNYHYARVMGMFNLIVEIQKTKDEHILLLGHSHAGQVFALLTMFINDLKFREQILELFKDEINPANFNSIDTELRNRCFDFVTFGSPCRYEWKLNSKMRLLHFINHREDQPFGGSISGAINTKSGDYIQQWATHGSDMISPIPKEMGLNLKLDKILGTGVNLNIMRKNILLKRRLHNEGHHILVDYGDEQTYPNFLQTLFGHVIYTKVELLAFHFNLIAEKFYQ